MNKFHSTWISGFVLVEWMMALAIISILCTIVITGVAESSQNRKELDTTTEQLVAEIKQVQMMNMLGYRSEGLNRPFMMIHKDHSFWLERASTVPGSEYIFPPYIENSDLATEVTFHSSGLPASESHMKLRDTRIKKVNHIWISKTTGRIRWEHGTDAEH